MKFKMGDKVEFDDTKDPARLGQNTHGRVVNIDSDGVNVICTVVCHFGIKKGKRDDRTYHVNAERMTIRERG